MTNKLPAKRPKYARLSGETTSYRARTWASILSCDRVAKAWESPLACGYRVTSRDSPKRRACSQAISIQERKTPRPKNNQCSKAKGMWFSKNWKEFTIWTYLIMRDDFRFFRTSLLVFWIRFCRTVWKTTKNKETNKRKRAHVQHIRGSLSFVKV